MAIGERIRFIRNLRGMTQKFLGLQVGFSERTADIRMAQYESGSRTPKADLVELLADALDVSTEALNVPNIDSYTGLMHTLFALEDLYGFKIDRLDDEICIRINRQNGSTFAKMTGLLEPWEEMAQKYRNGEISREEYDQWRYRYPRSEAERVASLSALRSAASVFISRAEKLSSKIKIFGFLAIALAIARRCF